MLKKLIKLFRDIYDDSDTKPDPVIVLPSFNEPVPELLLEVPVTTDNIITPKRKKATKRVINAKSNKPIQ